MEIISQEIDGKLEAVLYDDGGNYLMTLPRHKDGKGKKWVDVHNSILTYMENQQRGLPNYKEDADRVDIIDCYIPELELIIQFNGNKWHESEESKLRDNTRHKQISSAGYKVIWIHENFDENRRISPYDIFITTQSNKVFDSRYDEMIKKALLKINEMYPNRIESNVINQCLENKYKLQNLYIASKEHKLWKKRYKSKLY